LHFEVVGGQLPLDYQPHVRNVEFEFCSALNTLIASDGRNIVAIETEDGSHRIVHHTEREHRISCIHPKTGDIIFSTMKDDGAQLEFSSLVLSTGDISLVPLPPVSGEPFWGLVPHRIINLADGHRIYLGELEKGDLEKEDVGVGFAHLDASGSCIAWSEYIDLDNHFYHAWCRNNSEALFDGWLWHLRLVLRHT